MTDSPESPRILAGSATEDEVAAIAAVFAQLQVERAAAVEALPQDAAPSAWMRDRRALRSPLQPGMRWSDPR
ncbi:MAG: acyl-CoA carboxylase subunit epsilon [Amnibacterium sp.]